MESEIPKGYNRNDGVQCYFHKRILTVLKASNCTHIGLFTIILPIEPVNSHVMVAVMNKRRFLSAGGYCNETWNSKKFIVHR